MSLILIEYELNLMVSKYHIINFTNPSIALYTNTCIYESMIAYAREAKYGKNRQYRNDYRRS